MSDENELPELWNGFNLDSNGFVNDGCVLKCVCCGKCFGVVCTIIDGSEPPTPVWPFKQDNCPMCPLREEAWQWRTSREIERLSNRTLQERLAEYKAKLTC